MLPRARSLVQRLLRSRGYDVVRFSPDPLGRVVTLLARTRADVVLDVGANAGQYFSRLRAAGYAGRVISFEPNPVAFQALQASAARDPRWRGLAVGLGRDEGQAQLTIAANSEFSSFRRARAGAERIDGGIAQVGQTTVPVRTLSKLWDELSLADARPFLKLDVQGFEREVLAGAGDRLERCVGIQLELPFEPLYEDQPLLGEIVQQLLARNFAVYALFEGARDQASGALVEADVVLFNRSML
jgi:FkbM family methyltransferase